MEIARNFIGFLTVVAFVLLACVFFTSKRRDVSWLRFLTLGLSTLIAPSQFIREDRIRLLIQLLLLWVLLFIATWVLSWMVDNAQAV